MRRGVPPFLLEAPKGFWGDPVTASSGPGGQFDGGEQHAEVGEDPLAAEGGHTEGEDAAAGAQGVKGDLPHLVVQVDPDLPAAERDEGVGGRREGHAELVVLLQAPDLGVGLEEDPAFPPHRFPSHPHGPEAPARLHLPVVATRGEALAAQHARIRVETARALRPAVPRSAPGGLLEVLGEDHLGAGRGGIQGDIHWKGKERKSREEARAQRINYPPKSTPVSRFSRRKGEEVEGLQVRLEVEDPGGGGPPGEAGDRESRRWRQKEVEDLQVRLEMEEQGGGGSPGEARTGGA